jgi:hypothetical protein
LSCRKGTQKRFFQDVPNRYVVVGGVVSGPKKDDKFLDKRANYTYTEVALDYNTLLTTAYVALASAPQSFWSVDCSQYIVDYPWADARKSVALYDPNQPKAIVDQTVVEPPSIYYTGATTAAAGKARSAPVPPRPPAAAAPAAPEAETADEPPAEPAAPEAPVERTTPVAPAEPTVRNPPAAPAATLPLDKDEEARAARKAAADARKAKAGA